MVFKNSNCVYCVIVYIIIVFSVIFYDEFSYFKIESLGLRQGCNKKKIYGKTFLRKLPSYDKEETMLMLMKNQPK